MNLYKKNSNQKKNKHLHTYNKFSSHLERRKVREDRGREKESGRSGVVVHSFNPTTQEGRCRQSSLSSRPAWATQGVTGLLELHGDSQPQNK